MLALLTRFLVRARRGCLVALGACKEGPGEALTSTGP